MFLIATCNRCYCQRINGSDTIPATIYYNDTSCHFNSGDVQSIYNSRCMKEEAGYVVYWMYTIEYLDRNRKHFGGNVNLWFYKPRP